MGVVGRRWFDITFTSRPPEIWNRLIEWNQDGTLWSNTWVTIQEIVFGSALGSAAGAVLGFPLAAATVFFLVFLNTAAGVREVDRGLGYLIGDAASQSDTAGVFVTLVVLSVIAVVLNLLVSLLDRRMSRWKPLEART